MALFVPKDGLKYTLFAIFKSFYFIYQSLNFHNSLSIGALYEYLSATDRSLSYLCYFSFKKGLDWKIFEELKKKYIFEINK